MKNVLFVGPYRQDDGWGNASKEYIRSLRLIEDINLAVRPVYLSGQTVFSKFDEFEANELAFFDNYDVVIQHGLPEMFRYYGGAKNIGLCFTETSNIMKTPWVKSINLMDEMWVSSEYEKLALEKSWVDTTINVVHIGTNPEKYKKEYPKIKDLDDGTYNFYFIGEYIGRKNIDSLLLAYFRAFSANHNVRLILKLNRVGADADTLYKTVVQEIRELRSSLGVHASEKDYPEVVIITYYLDSDILYGLHQSCHCFVTASYGEAFCIPAFDAMMFGNRVMVNKNSSMAEYKPSNLIESTLVPAVATPSPLPYLYNGADSWYSVNSIELSNQMYQASKSENTKFKDISRPEYEYAAIAEVMRKSIYAE